MRAIISAGPATSNVGSLSIKPAAAHHSWPFLRSRASPGGWRAHGKAGAPLPHLLSPKQARHHSVKEEDREYRTEIGLGNPGAERSQRGNRPPTVGTRNLLWSCPGARRSRLLCQYHAKRR